jgi:hypothetical protein
MTVKLRACFEIRFGKVSAYENAAKASFQPCFWSLIDSFGLIFIGITPISKHALRDLSAVTIPSLII